MRQQVLDLTTGLRRQALQNVAQVGPWVAAVQARRLHEAHHDGGGWPASSLPTNIHARRPVAPLPHSLLWRSRWWLSMATAPSSRCRVSAAQCTSV